MAKQEKVYKDTLNITRTEFPQRAKLTQREPERLAHWREIGLQEQIDKKGERRPKYIMHDGPPYANGDIHLGHALNKILKDIVVRYQTMRGHHAPYVPGFDCHGLPIEQKVFDTLGRDAGQRDPVEVRRLCHEYATKYIGLQTEQFQRLGVGGDWEHPYLTLDPQYEVGILSALREMVARGYVTRGFKPVYWDTKYRTALAEAEIEYEEHTSPSIYVRFPVVNPDACAALADHAPYELVIWTTTPWTLPANLAVCVHPDLEYVLFEVEAGRFVCAKGRLEAFAQEAGLGEPRVLATLGGAELEGLRCTHPLRDIESVVILGDHVTLEQGTGCVHTAPGHGVEDFEVCRRYEIEVFQPVDDTGCYNELYPEMQGVSVWDANPRIIERLSESGRLLWSGKVTHQYPHSWRSHEPVLVRATDQWFMTVDHDELRAKALKSIDDVRWVPRWGRERIFNMMANRPDWCLSRQRAWGVPIPALRSVKAGRSILVLEVIDKFIEYAATEGSDCWFKRPVEDFVPEGFTCPISGGTEFEKDYDILDVWFDSGSSHISVLEQREGLESPADLYLEGSDQHRGWFMSSLTVSQAVRDRAPYKTVLTHGFLLDGEGQAMSKSKGNVISPIDVVGRMGADVLRLWVVSEDYRNDVAASEELFKQTQETYRRVRNTLRFLLGNLTDFEPASNTVAVTERTELDRWALDATAQLVERCTRAYDDFEFHRVYHLCHQFCSVTMSAVYLDVLKDRLYCSATDDHVRRSAQSTLYDIFRSLTGLLAPVMPFTTDEAYEYGPDAKASIHLEDFPTVGEGWRDAALAEKWDELLAVRDCVLRPMETLRAEKTIGKSLDAAVVLKPRSKRLATVLAENLELLRDLVIVSQCELDDSQAEDRSYETLDEELEVTVDKASGEKCARCWTWSIEVGDDTEHPDLCGRCADVVRRIG